MRFEVILTVEDWTRIDPARSKNPRNAGNGIMGRKNGHQSDCLTIFAFDLDETRDGQSVDFGTETAKLARLAELGFSVIAHQRCDSADEAVAYFDRIARTRDTLPFWIDGVVFKIDDLARQREMGVTAGRPKGQVAWKFDSSGAETVIEGVVISGGHTGGLYPTAQLAPVEIGGTTVSNVSLANFDEIARLDVAVGDSVWVVKANDIIPKVIRVTARPPGRVAIEIPTVCPFCGCGVRRRLTSGGTEGVMLACHNAACPEKTSGKIRRWIASLDIQGIGDVILDSMIEHLGLVDAADLYTLHQRAAEMAELVTHAERDLRLGDKRTASILAAIEATRSLPVGQFLGSLGLDHLGKRRAELMIKGAAGGLDTLADWRSGRLRDPAFAAAAGVPSIGAQIQDGIDAMAGVIDKMLAAGVKVTATGTAGGADDAALRPSVCISGKLPSGKKKADYEAPLHAAGYQLVDEVGKGLSLLVLADPASNSSKADKARKLGIEAHLRRAPDADRRGAGAGTDFAAAAAHPAPVPENPAVKATSPKETAMPKTTAATPPAQGGFQRFEFKDDKSSKFWEVRVAGSDVEVRYGKIGTAGQAQSKSFDNAAAAAAQASKQIAEKQKGGYLAAGTAASQMPAVAPVPAPKPKPLQPHLRHRHRRRSPPRLTPRLRPRPQPSRPPQRKQPLRPRPDNRRRHRLHQRQAPQRQEESRLRSPAARGGVCAGGRRRQRPELPGAGRPGVDEQQGREGQKTRRAGDLGGAADSAGQVS